jgi:hypothetical protein
MGNDTSDTTQIDYRFLFVEAAVGPEPSTSAASIIKENDRRTYEIFLIIHTNY